MIRWITERIGTASWDSVPEDVDAHRIDVRDLVDRSGNPDVAVRAKIDEAVAALEAGRRVIVCCDYGLSRSNVIAAGVLARQLRVPIADAIRMVMEATDSSAIRVDLLGAVERTLEATQSAKRLPGDSRRVAVTGATGFIGRRVVPLLRAAGAEVFTPTRQHVDLARDAVSLHLLIQQERIGTVLHLANPRAFSTNEALGESLTLLKNVLDVALENEIALIHLSGWEIYSGYGTQGMLADESTPACPGSTYGQAKWLAESLLRHYRERSGLRAAIVRSSPAYGPDSEKPKFLWNFVRKALRNEEIVAHKYRNGEPHLDLLHVDDLAAVITRATIDQIAIDVNVGTGSATSTTEVAERIVAIIGSKSVIRHIEVAGEAPNVAMDARLANRLLGWTARVSLDEGLRAVIADEKDKRTRVPREEGGR